MEKTHKIIIVGILITVAIGGTVYFFYFNKNISIQDKIKEQQVGKVRFEHCLVENESADYVIEKRGLIGGIVKVNVQSKEGNSIIKSFTIDDVFKNYHPVELRRCGIYVIRMFNYNLDKVEQNPGYKDEIWKYDYAGDGEDLVLLSEKPKEFVSYFSPDFRIDPNEKYLVLEKSYLGHDDYALVIKDLSTKENLLVLNLKDIIAKYPDIISGSFGLGSWTKDGEYFYGDIFQGALSTAYYVIKAEIWKVDVYAAPTDILAGVERAINFQNLHLAYVDIPTFTGFQEIYEQIIKEAKEKGRQKNLYLYNLVTKEKIKVASADPEWRFNLSWLSDTELQYELPTGGKKIFVVK